jgi:hypothetical protein
MIMTMTPEIERAARAMYADSPAMLSYYGNRKWEDFCAADHEDLCQAFAAGLAALLREEPWADVEAKIMVERS